MEIVEKVIEKIREITGKSREEILEEIKEKEKEFFGLVSFEGAAKLVARDYGLNLEDFTIFTPLGELVEGMKNVSLKARIVRIFPPKEFERKDGSKGRISIVILGDNSGFARLILWDKQTEIIENKEIQEGDVIRIYGARTRENIFGGIDIILSKFSSIEEIKDEEIPPLEELSKRFSETKSYEKIKIKDAREGFFEIKGTIVHVYRTKNIFYSCPKCFSSVAENNGKFVCEIHGEVKPIKALVIAAEIDDGTSTIRCVFFRDVAENVLGIKSEEFDKMENEEKEKLLKEKLIGKMVIVKGRIKRNKIFGNLEIIANEAQDLNIQNEIEKILKTFEAM